ncbi:HdeD family acid-resistance protein [Actinoplanes sp. URMC 104]|uniref:HdeD family acid-resistance protein n=1 Tax=Actinoplanes sp. URMC 104 TaxID=3423409 RepID=UPI003F1B13FA
MSTTHAPMSASFTRSAERSLWWLAVAGAASSIVLGVLALAWPDETLYVGAALFGVWLLVHGVINIVQAITAARADGAARALSAVIGVLFVVAGVICLRNVLVSVVVIATLIGISWLIGGIVGLINAFTAGHDAAGRLVLAALGAVSVLGGLVVLLWPGPSLATIVWLTGIWLLLMGLIQLLMVLRNRPGHAAV